MNIKILTYCLLATVILITLAFMTAGIFAYLTPDPLLDGIIK